MRGRAFLKPVFKEGQGGAQDHVSHDQEGEFHSSSSPALRRLSRLQEKEKEKCSSSSCAPALAKPMPINSGSSSACSGCTDRRGRRQRTPSTSLRGVLPHQYPVGFICHRATAIIVCAIFFLDVLLCCRIRSRNVHQSRARHGQLLELLKSSSSRSTEPLPKWRVVQSWAEPVRKLGPAKSASSKKKKEDSSLCLY